MSLVHLTKKKRFYVFFGGLFILFGLNVFSLARLQFFDNEDLLEWGQKQREREIVLSPKRGTIYDTNMRELAISIDVDSLFAHPKSIDNPEHHAHVLAPIIGVHKRELLNDLKSGKSFVWLKRHITPNEKKKVEELNLPGIDFLKISKRYYPKDELAGQVLGFAGVDNQGLEGLELYYDSELKGAEGWYISIKDARHRVICTQQKWVKKPTAGMNLVLTIDEVIQYFAEKELADVCRREQAKSGSLVVMDPTTGAILALANYPLFDPNRFIDSSAAIWRNKAIVDLVQPGSTIKSFILSSGLELGAITLSDTFDCRKGEITVAGHTFHDWKRFGILHLWEVLANSSNVGSIMIGEKMGKRLYGYLRAFGFGGATGVDFPGEPAGKLNSPDNWSAVSVPSLSIGYELSASALQIVTAYAALVNDGVMMQPRLVREIRNEHGEVSDNIAPKVLKTVLSRKTAQRMKSMLMKTITDGTASGAAIDGYEIGGKTGTTRIFDKQLGRYNPGKVLASFVGFYPVKNPEYVIGVLINQPKANKWGSSAAAPVFQRVAEQIIRYKGIQPTTGTIVAVADIEDIAKFDPQSAVAETAQVYQYKH